MRTLPILLRLGMMVKRADPAYVCHIHILGVMKGGEVRFRTASSRYSSPLRLLFPHTPRGLRKGNNTLLWVIRPGNFLSPTFPMLFIPFLFPYHITCMCYCTGQNHDNFFTGSLTLGRKWMIQLMFKMIFNFLVEGRTYIYVHSIKLPTV